MGYVGEPESGTFVPDKDRCHAKSLKHDGHMPQAFQGVVSAGDIQSAGDMQTGRQINAEGRFPFRAGLWFSNAHPNC
jgi:hypothetical protein